MKKLICAALILALAASTLTACHRTRSTEGEPEATAAANFNPDGGPGYSITDGTGQGGQIITSPIDENVSDKEMAALESQAEANAAAEAEANGLPTAEPEAPQEPELGTYDEENDTAQHAEPTMIDTSNYQYNAVMEDSLDYTFNYPAHWEQVPGIYTVCFREKVEPGEFPARVAITRKKLVHTPDDEVILEELTSYMKNVYKQYDPKTFQTSTPDVEATFMGQKALSNTYLAYWGETEVKGFVIGCAVERTLYVFHFCASYSDYVALQNVMQYMLKSVQLKNPPEKKKK